MSKNRNDRKTVRNIEAEGRREMWEGLTPQQQLESLDRRLGALLGAKKQRARIAKALTKEEVKS